MLHICDLLSFIHVEVVVILVGKQEQREFSKGAHLILFFFFVGSG